MEGLGSGKFCQSTRVYTAGKVGNFYVLLFATHEINQLLLIEISQVMGHGRGGEAHKVSRPYLKSFTVDFSNASGSEDINPLFFSVMGMIHK